jgi:hypothetical protein
MLSKRSPLRFLRTEFVSKIPKRHSLIIAIPENLDTLGHSQAFILRLKAEVFCLDFPIKLLFGM